MLVAALGGHLDVVELLIKNGADAAAKLDFRGVKHGLVEIGMIREDFALLDLAFNLCAGGPEVAAKRVLTLIGLERLDMDSRVSVGRSLYRLALEYTGTKLNNSSSLTSGPVE